MTDGQLLFCALLDDGISITFGHPRNHIWTFAATRNSQDYCPCITSGNAALCLSTGTTFVKLAYVIVTALLLPTIHSGMVRAVLAPMPAVNSTTLHGSVSS